jgi:hypothetical protein
MKTLHFWKLPLPPKLKSMISIAKRGKKKNSHYSNLENSRTQTYFSETDKKIIFKKKSTGRRIKLEEPLSPLYTN